MAQNPDYSEFSDPRLVAIYDTVNAIREYKDFYLELGKRLAATSIIDIGCGTGLLTYELSKQGHKLIAVEPSLPMIERTLERVYDGPIRFIHGGVESLDSLGALEESGALHFDLAIMTGHVAQFFLEDADWQAALASIHKALRPGGHIAFECRNPVVQPWFIASSNSSDSSTSHAISHATSHATSHAAHIDWPSATNRRKVTDPAVGAVEWWSQLIEVIGDRVIYEIHYLFPDSDVKLVSINELRFRDRTTIEKSLRDAGFVIENVYGNWDFSLADAASPEFIFVAYRY
ncbi:class I SAM-dependent methyltransferase [soil metagenome]